MPTPTPHPNQDAPHLLLVDAFGHLFRYHHALPPMHRPADNLPTGALRGFCNLLLSLHTLQPTHVGVCFDPPGHSFRRDVMPSYKANRSDTPPDLVPQLHLARQAATAFRLRPLETPGLEADDLIASYAALAQKRRWRVTIASTDKDLMQCVRPNVLMFDSFKNLWIDELAVQQRFGAPPDKVAEIQALAGDPTDNIPGAAGIGVKTAADLIAQHGSLQNILDARHNETKPKRRLSLDAFAPLARQSLILTTLKNDAAPPVPLDELAFEPPQPLALIGFLKDLAFSSLVKRAAKTLNANPNDVPPTPVHLPDKLAPEAKSSASSPPASASPPPETFNLNDYQVVQTLDDLNSFLHDAAKSGALALQRHTLAVNDADPPRLLGVALAARARRAVYLPLESSLRDAFLKALKPPLESLALQKTSLDAKGDILALRRLGVNPHPMDDVALMSAAMESGVVRHELAPLARRHLQYERPDDPVDVPAAETNSLIPQDAEAASDTNLALLRIAQDADIALRLHMRLKPLLPKRRAAAFYASVERPMPPVLADMEAAGVLVDLKLLHDVGADFQKRLDALREDIRRVAGDDLNPASPKQVAERLFGDLNVKGLRKTPKGARSVAADVLETLALDHELPRLILDWRALAKLLSTYVEALPRFVRRDDGRVHTSFALSATSTGRLASAHPNLQNIPARTADGRRIRRAFIAPQGTALLVADYNQIELRMLAHISQDSSMLEAFRQNLDIHAQTARELFKSDDRESRNRAKAVNFGVIYGLSPFGLARQIGVPQHEARDYIEQYFQRFPGVAQYVRDVVESCRESGWVQTLFGRRCNYRNINASRAPLRAAAQRAAVNAPIQGAAADLVRRAMIRIAHELSRRDMKSRMILQVHDELVFEAPHEELDALGALARKVMIGAAQPAVNLRVPLEVSISSAPSWEEAH